MNPKTLPTDQIASFAIQDASKYYLTKQLPDDWENFNAKQLLRFIEDHKEEHYKHFTNDEILLEIRELAGRFSVFFIQVMFKYFPEDK